MTPGVEVMIIPNELEDFVPIVLTDVAESTSLDNGADMGTFPVT